MYDHMIPTMQKVFTEIRDLVTYPAGRIVVEELIIYTKIDKSAFENWNWNDYYKYISLKGLEETNGFKQDFKSPSDAKFLLGNYINYGHA